MISILITLHPSNVLLSMFFLPCSSDFPVSPLSAPPQRFFDCGLLVESGRHGTVSQPEAKFGGPSLQRFDRVETKRHTRWCFLYQALFHRCDTACAGINLKPPYLSVSRTIGSAYPVGAITSNRQRTRLLMANCGFHAPTHSP